MPEIYLVYYTNDSYRDDLLGVYTTMEKARYAIAETIDRLKKEYEKEDFRKHSYIDIWPADDAMNVRNYFS